MSTNKVKVLIADDHMLFAGGLKTMIQKFIPDTNISAMVKNGQEALDAIAEDESIDLLIADIGMPVLNGIDLTRKVKQMYPNIKVLVISMHEDKEMVTEALLAEADGYILKSADTDQLIKAVTSILDNGTFYSGEIVPIILNDFNSKKKSNMDTVNSLTSREKEIIQLIMQEYSSEAIATKLHISKLTVDTHRKHILEKTQTKTLVGLCKFALRNRFLD